MSSLISPAPCSLESHGQHFHNLIQAWKWHCIVSATMVLANSDLYIENFLLSLQKGRKKKKKIRSWKASRLLSSKSHLKEIEMRRYLVTGLLPREADWGSKSDISLGRGCARVDTRHLRMPTASHPGQHPPRRRFPWISWSFGGSCRPVTGSLPSSAPRVSSAVLWGLVIYP